jgi:hypothetical protein
VAVIEDTLTDGVTAATISQPRLAYVVPVTTGVTMTPIVRYDYGHVVTEQIRVAPALAGKATYRVTTTGGFSMRPRIALGWPFTATDGVTIARTITVHRGVSVVEALRLSRSVAPSMSYRVTITDQMRLSDSLRRFFAGDLLDTVGLVTTHLPYYRFRPTLADGVGVADVSSPRLVFRVTAADSINLDDVDILRLVFRPTLIDAVEVSAAYISPGDTFTTWAINTRTGAVSEYDNFAFNSFAMAGRTYLAASKDGLYELIGDDDAGDDIIVRIRSGFQQFTGARLSMFKAVYLATRGGGDYVLKIEAGTGEVYTYNVKSNDMQTAKITVGKGLRARFFAFELISTGQDFDLESLEFVPISGQRRV